MPRTKRRSHVDSAPRTFSAEDRDRFCRAVLTELETLSPLLADIPDTRSTIADRVGKERHAVGKRIYHTESKLAEWCRRVQLIDHKHPKKIRITDAGRAFSRFASDVLTRSEAFLQELQRIEFGGHVELATIQSGWETFGSEITRMFQAKVPNSSVSSRYFTGNKYNFQIKEEVRTWRADVGITSYPPVLEEPLCVQPLLDQEMVLVLSSAYDRAPKASTVRIEELVSNDYNRLIIVVYRKELDIPAANKVKNYLSKHGAIPVLQGRERLLERENIGQIKQALQNDQNAISILPASAVLNEVEAGSFKTYHLSRQLDPWPWGIIYRTPIYRPAVRDFIECFKSLYKAQSQHRSKRR